MIVFARSRFRSLQAFYIERDHTKAKNYAPFSMRTEFDGGTLALVSEAASF